MYACLLSQIGLMIWDYRSALAERSMHQSDLALEAGFKNRSAKAERKLNQTVGLLL